MQRIKLTWVLGFILLNHCIASSIFSEDERQQEIIQHENHHQNVISFDKNIEIDVNLFRPTLPSREDYQDQQCVHSTITDHFESVRSCFITTERIPIDTWRHITSYLDYKTKLHQVNQYFFNVVTDYPILNIHHTGFRHHHTLQRSSLSQIQGFNIDFKMRGDRYLKTIPSYIWYSFISQVSNIPCTYWIHLKGTRVHTIDLYNHQIADAWNFEGILIRNQVCTFDLIKDIANDIGTCDLGWALRGTQVHTINLKFNNIGRVTASDSVKISKEMQIGNIDLGPYDISRVNMIEFGEALKGTQVHTVNLRENDLNHVLERDLREILQKIQVYKIHT